MIILGIDFKIINKKDCKIHDQVKIQKHDELNDEIESETENTEIQIKRKKTYFTKEDIVIEGSMALAELVDFLINQKDRNSYAILPEIYSPGPFIHGTLRNNSIIFSGPCKGVNSEIIHHFKINGITFPSSIRSLIHELESAGHVLTLNVEREPNTDFLSSYTHESYE